jgi:hypothetical protein
MTKRDANSAIAAENLTMGTVSYGYSDTVAAGLVIKQNPATGTTVPAGSSVNIMISLGQPLEVLTAGSNRLIQLQNNDGGWDLPLTNGDPNTGSNPETFAPVAMGLARAYNQINDSNMLPALQKAKTFLLNKADNFTVADGALAAELDNIVGGTGCTDHVAANFYDKLATGTYYDAFSSLTHDTASYIQYQRDLRASEMRANMATWDMGLGLYSAYVVGANTTPWLAALKAEIDELNDSQDYDILGLGGAIFGLGSTDEDYDPQTGWQQAASGANDMAANLTGYQLSTGGFTWNSAFMQEGIGNEMLQETAYALLGFNEVDKLTYFAVISNANIYLQTVQMASGGWQNYDPAGEDNLTTGEVLTAIAAAVPFQTDLYIDGQINLDDFGVLANAWLTKPGDDRWNPECDISVPEDNIIDELDLAALANDWLAGVR